MRGISASGEIHFGMQMLHGKIYNVPSRHRRSNDCDCILEDEVNLYKMAWRAGYISFEFYLVQQIAILVLRQILINTIVYLIHRLSTTILVAWLLNSLVTREITKMSSK